MFRSAVYGVCEEQMAYNDESSILCEFLVPFIRFWGVFTSVGLPYFNPGTTVRKPLGINLALRSALECFRYKEEFRVRFHFLVHLVMCGVGVDIAVHNHGIGYFYVICSGLVFFLEVSWIITLFIQVCSRNEFGPCMHCWTKVLWLRLWRKSVLYSLLALILFLKPHRLWLSIVAGLQLLVLAGLYLLLTYRAKQQSKVTPSPRLLNHSNSPSQDDYDKYDDITDVLDDALPGPLINDNLSELDQDTILEM